MFNRRMVLAALAKATAALGETAKEVQAPRQKQYPILSSPYDAACIDTSLDSRSISFMISLSASLNASSVILAGACCNVELWRYAKPRNREGFPSGLLSGGLNSCLNSTSVLLEFDARRV